MNNFYLYNEITGQTLHEFKEYLNENQAPVIRINSGGGEIFSAIAMYNLLKNKNPTIYIDGICASAATMLLCACKSICANNALIMMHLPSVFLLDDFNAEDLTKVHNALSAIQESIITTYSNKIKRSREEILNLLKAETWLNAEEAKNLGLVNEISEDNLNITNKLIMDKYKDSVLIAERGRIEELAAAKSENLAANAIIDVAIKNGSKLADVKSYIDAVQGIKNPGMAELIESIKDNLNSGVEGVGTSVPEATAEEKRATQAEMVAKYMNRYLGVRSKE